MRRITLLALLAYVTASLLVYCFGDSGLTAFARLEGYRDRLDGNVRELEGLNRSLQAELASLRDDPRRIEVLAHGLGLYRPEDRVLRIEGAEAVPEPYEIGTLLRLRQSGKARSPWLKAAGLGIAALAGILSFVLGRRDRRAVHGTRRR